MFGGQFLKQNSFDLAHWLLSNDSDRHSTQHAHCAHLNVEV
jgi:hypothetical protein